VVEVRSTVWKLGDEFGEGGIAVLDQLARFGGDFWRCGASGSVEALEVGFVELKVSVLAAFDDEYLVDVGRLVEQRPIVGAV
jgi:hypothetical protein